MAVCAAGSSGVGPGVKRRFFRSIVGRLLCVDNLQVYRKLAVGAVIIVTTQLAFGSASIIRSMSLVDQIQKDITAAMKARAEQRLSTLRMVKTALKNREIEKMAPLDEKESQAILTTLIKQRKESVEQFTKGGRQEMADKEAAEIVLI